MHSAVPAHDAVQDVPPFFAAKRKMKQSVALPRIAFAQTSMDGCLCTDKERSDSGAGAILIGITLLLLTMVVGCHGLPTSVKFEQHVGLIKFKHSVVVVVNLDRERLRLKFWKNFSRINFDHNLVLEEAIVTGTNQPFGIVTIPNTNQLIVSDRKSDSLLVLQDDMVVKKIPLSIPDRIIDYRYTNGLLGIAIDPEYAINNHIYLFLTLESLLDSDYANQAVLRLTYNASTKTLGRITQADILIEDVNRALTQEGNESGDASRHNSNGGRLLFVPDGTLLASFGYQHAPSSVQSMRSLGGKTARMFSDGRPVCGTNLGLIRQNPFCRAGFSAESTPEPQDYVYTLGHKNNQGLALVRDQIFVSEHGEIGGDEINLLTIGGNYGFPYLCSGSCKAYADGTLGQFYPLTGEQRARLQQDFIFPLYTWNGIGKSIPSSGIAFYAHDGVYKDSLIVTTLGTKIVFRFTIDENFNVALAGEVASGARFRDVAITDNGSIYITADGGMIYKLRVRPLPAEDATK